MPTPDLLCDVVIVGAGLTGAYTARRLAEAGLNVAVLEATAQAGGTGARGAGLALLGTPEPFVSLVDRLGRDRGREIWELTRKNLELLSAAAAQTGVSAQTVGSFRPTADSQEAQRFSRSVGMLIREGFAVELEDATEQGFMVGMHTREDLAFAPTALARALLNHPRITLQCNAEVQEMHLRAPGHIDIWVRKQYLWTRRVILAANAHALRLSPRLSPLLRPLAVQAVDCPAPAPLPAPLVLNGGQLIIQQRESQWRLVALPQNSEENPWPMLAQAAAQFCPEAPIVRRHSGWNTVSADGLPLVGELPDLPEAYIIGGLGPWGFSWALIAAEKLIRWILNQEDPGALALSRFRQD